MDERLRQGVPVDQEGPADEGPHQYDVVVAVDVVVVVDDVVFVFVDVVVVVAVDDVVVVFVDDVFVVDDVVVFVVDDVVFGGIVVGCRSVVVVVDVIVVVIHRLEPPQQVLFVLRQKAWLFPLWRRSACTSTLGILLNTPKHTSTHTTKPTSTHTLKQFCQQRSKAAASKPSNGCFTAAGCYGVASCYEVTCVCGRILIWWLSSLMF